MPLTDVVPPLSVDAASVWPNVIALAVGQRRHRRSRLVYHHSHRTRDCVVVARVRGRKRHPFAGRARTGGYSGRQPGEGAGYRGRPSGQIRRSQRLPVSNCARRGPCCHRRRGFVIPAVTPTRVRNRTAPHHPQTHQDTDPDRRPTPQFRHDPPSPLYFALPYLLYRLAVLILSGRANPNLSLHHRPMRQIQQAKSGQDWRFLSSS